MVEYSGRLQLARHISSHTAVHRRQTGPPTGWQNLLKLVNYVRPRPNVNRVVKNRITEKDNMAHKVSR